MEGKYLTSGKFHIEVFKLEDGWTITKCKNEKYESIYFNPTPFKFGNINADDYTKIEAWFTEHGWRYMTESECALYLLNGEIK